LDYTGANDTIQALSNEILKTIREVALLNPLFRENVQFHSQRSDSNDPYRLAGFAANACSVGTAEDFSSGLGRKGSGNETAQGTGLVVERTGGFQVATRD
jgi:Lon-like ATP-dependent protease